MNGDPVPYLMKVGEAGEAFFVFETDHEVPEEFQTSPILQALAENKSNVEVTMWLKLKNHRTDVNLKDPPFLDISEKNNENSKGKQKKIVTRS